MWRADFLMSWLVIRNSRISREKNHWLRPINQKKDYESQVWSPADFVVRIASATQRCKMFRIVFAPAGWFLSLGVLEQLIFFSGLLVVFMTKIFTRYDSIRGLLWTTQLHIEERESFLYAEESRNVSTVAPFLEAAGILNDYFWVCLVVVVVVAEEDCLLSDPLTEFLFVMKA